MKEGSSNEKEERLASYGCFPIGSVMKLTGRRVEFVIMKIKSWSNLIETQGNRRMYSLAKSRLHL